MHSVKPCFFPVCAPRPKVTRPAAAVTAASLPKRGGIFADAVLEEANRLRREREDAQAAQETTRAEFLAMREDIRAIREDVKAATRIAASAVVVGLFLRLI